jgi:hypothetical protein
VSRWGRVLFSTKGGCVVKRKRRKLHALKQRERGWGGSGRLSNMSGVSRALWPVELRQSAAVGRNAQRRRMMRSLWWSVRLYLSQVQLLYVWFAVALLAGGCLLVLLVLRQRHTFVIVTMLAIVTVLHVLCGNLWQLLRPRLMRLPHLLNAHLARWCSRMMQSSIIKEPHTQKTQVLRELSSMRAPHLSMALRAPETPMPEASLIRVLETIDLSTCNVEHFLDTSVDLRSLPALDEDECFTDEYMMI